MLVWGFRVLHGFGPFFGAWRLVWRFGFWSFLWGLAIGLGFRVLDGLGPFFGAWCLVWGLGFWMGLVLSFFGAWGF